MSDCSTRSRTIWLSGAPSAMSVTRPESWTCRTPGLADGAASISWGEILGASGYKLYARLKTEKDYQLLYAGPERAFTDRRAFIRAADPSPGRRTNVSRLPVVEYLVAAVNGIGEGVGSSPADTDPSSWRNWDPRPHESFRRVTSFPPDAAGSGGGEQHYYPE